MSIYKKLLDFRKEEISLTRDTKAFNYSYANLEQIQTKISPILETLKLVVIHFVKDGYVYTQIRDIEDDSFIESSIEIWNVEITREWTDQKWIANKEYNNKDPQWVGSIITYYRRYNLLALLDLETEDDDGASASGKAKAKVSSAKPKEKHTCRACWEVVDAEIFEGKFWPCFKCDSCGKFSKPNLLLPKDEWVSKPEWDK